MRGLRERTLAWLHRRPGAQAWALLAPGGFWLVAFFLVPILIMLAYWAYTGYAHGRRWTFEGMQLDFCSTSANLREFEFWSCTGLR